MDEEVRIDDLAARGVVTAADGSGKIRTLQVLLLSEDLRNEVEHFEPYGFTSEPLAGAEVLTTSLCGDREHTIAVVTPDRRYRPVNLKAGEVVIFDNKGRKVYLSEGGIVVEGVSSPITVRTTGTVTIDAPTVKMTGNLEVAGSIKAAGDISDHNNKSMSGMRSVYNSHKHGGGTTPDTTM